MLPRKYVDEGSRGENEQRKAEQPTFHPGRRRAALAPRFPELRQRHLAPPLFLSSSLPIVKCSFELVANLQEQDIR